MQTKILALSNLDITSTHYRAAAEAAKTLHKHGFKAYIIGGAVRDILLGHTPKDFDLVTDATPEQVLDLPELAKAYYKDTAQAYGVTRVFIKLEDEDDLVEVEIATFRRDIEAHLGRKLTRVEFTTLAEDVTRRDFTINALALDLVSQEVHDYVGGLADLEQKLLRFIGEPRARLQEDPLRLLRALRLKNQLGLVYDYQAATAIKQAVGGGMVAQIAVDRVRKEISRMITNANRFEALLDLERFGIIDHLLPELAATKGVTQPPQFHSEGDVWQHSLLVMKYLPAKISVRLAWAALLHDVGKPVTKKTATETGDHIRFSDHYSVGSEIARDILKRLQFSNTQIADITWMIHYHLAIDALPQMRPSKQTAMLSHPAFADLLELHKADAHAAWSPKSGGQLDTGPAAFPELEALWQQYQSRSHLKKPSLKDDLGIDGSWLMAEFKLETGPQLGQLLASLNEAYLDGDIKSRAEAKRFIKNKL